jgi:quercetin dioxygenase-like cupin family protein
MGREAVVADLAALAQGDERRIAWEHATEDLNLNLVVLGAGGTIAEHPNAEVDVLLVGVDGEGIVAVDGEPNAVRAGRAIVIPKGTRRSIQSVGERFSYLTCHRRREGLWPAPPQGRGRDGNDVSGGAER